MKIIINVFQIVCLIMLAFFFTPSTGDAESLRKISSPDLSNHPIYSDYKFDNTDAVVNIGIQPAYSPTGLITETMKRDIILRENLSRLGMKIRFFAFLKGDDVNFFLRRGSIDAGIGGDMPAITAAATMDVIIPALVQQGFTSVVAKRLMLIRELRGRKVGYALGSNAHYALLRALSSDGLSEAQVKLIPMEVTGMPEALQAGKITAFSAWEPTITIALMKYPDNVVVHRYLSSGYLYFTKIFSDKYPEVVRQILAAEIRAFRWIQGDKQNLLLASEWAISAIEDLTNHKFELSVKQNAKLAKDDLLGLIPVPIIPGKTLSQDGPLFSEFVFLKDLGKIPTSINWDRVRNSFDIQIITDVLVNTVKYKFNEFDYDIE